MREAVWGTRKEELGVDTDERTYSMRYERTRISCKACMCELASLVQSMSRKNKVYVAQIDSLHTPDNDVIDSVW